ncbi:MAG: hypothetical protein AAGG44_13645 [Planctomycetota bacterium]
MSTQDSARKYRVASIELISVACQEHDPGNAVASGDGAQSGFHSLIALRDRESKAHELSGCGDTLEKSLASAVRSITNRDFDHELKVDQTDEGETRFLVTVEEQGGSGNRAGIGRYLAGPDDDRRQELGFTIGLLRAVSHAGLLKADYRANNQKIFRGWAKELVDDLVEVLEVDGASTDASDSTDAVRRLEAESLILEHTNRVASSAVVTAANHPRPDSVLGLFDTSVWLFESNGRRRDSYTDTDLWLAWYPGVENEDKTVREVIDSMPRAPATKIPWIVKLFENPESWIRFRGAVDLEDHDVMHVLLGRGLQDQDEAFVIGFAMGTAKKVSWFQYWVFKFVIGRLYPEPYRIPPFLQPAFDLGVQCGKETGTKNLYQRDLKELLEMPLAQAREDAGIDMRVVQKYFELEQQKIPSTIASLRLP